MAVWGLCALQAGDTTKARECLEIMHALSGPVRPVAYLALARLRYEEVLKKSEAKAPKFDDAQIAQVLEPLVKAMALPPPMKEEFQLLLDVCDHSAATLDAKSRETLRGAIGFFPADAELRQRIEKMLGKEAAPHGSRFPN